MGGWGGGGPLIRVCSLIRSNTVVIRVPMHKLRHFHWTLRRSADSTASKNDVIHALSDVGASKS